MKTWLQILRRRLCDEPAVIRVVVAVVRGSAPREPGACMLIGMQRCDGSIGGGHLELKAMDIARQMLRQPAIPTGIERFSLGATLGQCCGGAVTLWFERFTADDLDNVEAALRQSQKGEPAVMVSQLHGSGGTRHPARRLFARPMPRGAAVSPQVGRAVDDLLSAPPHAPRACLADINTQEVLLERIDPQGHSLWLYGAGHVGKALVSVLADLPFQVTWVDSREDAFPDSLPPNVHLRHANDPATTVTQAPSAAFFLVMTHSHEFDYDICRAILGREEFAWAGLIGSETKAACFNLRLARDGVTPERVARLVSPIGIDGIDSKLPGVIAVSVAAQLLQVAQRVECAPPVFTQPFLPVSEIS